MAAQPGTKTTIHIDVDIKKRFDKIKSREQQKAGRFKRVYRQDVLIALMDLYEQQNND